MPPLVWGILSRRRPVLREPTVHLLGRSREAGRPQLAPQGQPVLAAFREPWVDSGTKRNGLSKADLDVSAKLPE